jgi:hypothetical protein
MNAAVLNISTFPRKNLLSSSKRFHHVRLILLRLFLLSEAQPYNAIITPPLNLEMIASKQACYIKQIFPYEETQYRLTNSSCALQVYWHIPNSSRALQVYWHIPNRSCACALRASKQASLF